MLCILALRLGDQVDELLHFFDERLFALRRQQSAKIGATETNSSDAGLDIFLNVFQIHAARHHEARVRKRPLHLTNEIRPAGQIRRENFHQVGMRPLRRDNLRRRRRTGKACDVRRMAKSHQIQLQRRRDDELGADAEGALRLL